MKKLLKAFIVVSFFVGQMESGNRKFGQNRLDEKKVTLGKKYGQLLKNSRSTGAYVPGNSSPRTLNRVLSEQN